MAHIAWSDKLNTGIQVIDSQYHRIVEYINQLTEAQQQNDRRLTGDVPFVKENMPSVFRDEDDSWIKSKLKEFFS